MLLIWDNTPEGSSISHALLYLESYLENVERLGIWNNKPKDREGILDEARAYRRRILDTFQMFPNFGLEVRGNRIHLVVSGSVVASWLLDFSEEPATPGLNANPEDYNMRRLVEATEVFIALQEMRGGVQSMDREEILTRATDDVDDFVGALERCPGFHLAVYGDRIDLHIPEGVCATWRRAITSEFVQAKFASLIAWDANDRPEGAHINARIISLKLVVAGFHKAMGMGDREKMSQALLMFMVDTSELLVLMGRLVEPGSIPAIGGAVVEPGDLESVVSGFMDSSDPYDRYNSLFAFIQEIYGFFTSFGEIKYVEDMVTQFLNAENPTDKDRYLFAFIRETHKMFVWLFQKLGQGL